MLTFNSGNNKTWAEMTPQEQKVCLIVIGIIILGLLCYGTYYYLKSRNKRN